MEHNQIGLYLHIPFCIRKCQYCDFLSFPASAAVREQYVQALCREIQSGLVPEEVYEENGVRGSHIATVFFGGGTPSLLSGEQISRLMDGIRHVYHLERDAEISLEANPGTVTAKSLADYRMAGVNRLSFGLQSAQNQELCLLGRIHTWEEFQESYQLAREAGFTNINIDLMSALPGQSLDAWVHTLEQVLALKPEHISAYSLIIEEGTPFDKIYGKEHQKERQHESGILYAPLPDEDTERRMYEVTEEILREAGLQRYEISNYARPGYECRHNCSYWKRTPYLGFGLGASSYWKETRWKDTSDLSFYLRSWTENETCSVQPLWTEIISLSRSEQMAEFLYLGLRMMEGVKEREFFRQFGQSLDEVYGSVLTRQERLGVVERKNGRLRLTHYGIDVSNQVLWEYLPPE